MLCSSFFFSGFTFYKEALCFIIFILSLRSNMLNLENILEYIRQKLKKHAQDEVFTRLFLFVSSWDEISSLSFTPEWNFICLQETFHHRQGWFHPGTSFIPGWNFTCKHPLSVLRQKQSCSHGVKDGCKNLQRFSFKLLKPFCLSSEQGLNKIVMLTQY